MSKRTHDSDDSDARDSELPMEQFFEFLTDEPTSWEGIGYDGRAHVYEVLSRMARADDAAANMALLFMGLTSQENYAERTARWPMVTPENKSVRDLYVGLFAVAIEMDSEETFDLLVNRARGTKEFQDMPVALQTTIARACGRIGLITAKWVERAFPSSDPVALVFGVAPMFYYTTARGLIEGAHWAKLNEILEVYLSKAEVSFDRLHWQKGLKVIVKYAVEHGVDALNVLNVSPTMPDFLALYTLQIADTAAFYGKLEVLEWLQRESAFLILDDILDDYDVGLAVYDGASRGKQLNVLNFALQHWQIADFVTELQGFYQHMTPSDLKTASWLFEHGITLPVDYDGFYTSLTADNLSVADWLFDHGAPLPSAEDLVPPDLVLLSPPLAVIKWFVAHGAIPSPGIYELAGIEAEGTTAYLDELFELGVPLPQEPLRGLFYPELAADIIRVLDWFRRKGVRFAGDLYKNLQRAYPTEANTVIRWLERTSRSTESAVDSSNSSNSD